MTLAGPWPVPMKVRYNCGLTCEPLNHCPACRRGLMGCVGTIPPAAEAPLPKDTS